MPPDLSLRGPNGAVAISGRQLRFRRSLPVIHHCTARFPRRFAPRNDTSGEREVHQRPYAVKWACTWRSLTAATDAIGLCVLSIPNTNRRCTAGRDMSLPNNAWPKARELFILHFSVFSIHLFLRAPPLQRTSGSLVKFYTTKYPPFPDTGCRFRRYIPFFRRDYRRGGGQNRTPFSPRPPA